MKGGREEECAIVGVGVGRVLLQSVEGAAEVRVPFASWCQSRGRDGADEG